MIALWENFRMALEALRANKMRSLLTTLGIVIGIATVIAIVSIVEGLNDAFAAELQSIGQGVLYVQKFPWGHNDWRKFRHYPDISWKEYEALVKDAKLVGGISPMQSTRKSVKWRNKKLELIEILGVNEQYASIRGVFPEKGRNITRLDNEHGRDVCLLGYEVAEKLFGPHNPIGESIRVGLSTFQVIGVISKRGDFFDQNLDRFVLIPFSAFQRTLRAHHGFTIIIKVADPTQIEAAKDELRSILRRVRKVEFTKPDNFSINQVDALKEMYDKLTGGLYAAMFAVATIALLVGGIGIMNIMLVSVTERTVEIGIRKALGARRRWIMLQFLVEALIISFIGGVLGILTGIGLAKLVAALTPLQASVKIWSIVIGLTFSSAVGLFFGIFPARAAARKHPIEALHYE